MLFNLVSNAIKFSEQGVVSIGLRGMPAGQGLMAITLAMMWLVCVLGWFADDSGIIVPATALPLALPLGFALLAGVPFMRDDTAERGWAITGSSVTGRIG